MHMLFLYNTEVVDADLKNTVLLDAFEQWQQEFYDMHRPLCANNLYINSMGMNRLQRCYEIDDNHSFGMDLIDGEFNIDANIKMDVTPKRLIYAIASFINEDEPVYLLRDDTMADGQAMLKWSPSNDEDDDYLVPANPVDFKKKAQVLVR